MLNTSRLQSLAALLAVAAWMLLAHPYQGLRHDGILYFGQVLLNSRVPGLSHDIFFAGGSQDRYSIYSHVMVPLYEHLGVMATNVAVLLSGWVLMMGAVLALLRRFAPTHGFPFWGLLAFAVMSPVYGGTWVFGYGETFVTARNFAEPLLLWSLVALLAGRWHLTVALQVLAALFHPLMALPVMAMSWGYLAGRERRWLWVLVAIPVVLIAALAGVAPWDGLLKTYDPYWWALVETGNRQVLLGNWTLQDKLSVVLDLVVLLAVCRLRPPDDWTRLIQAVVIITGTFIGLTALAVDGWHAVLLTQLQFWRAHWVAHLTAMALAPWLLARLWNLGGLWPASACALALALLNAHIGMDHGIATLCLWALASLAAWRSIEVARSTVWLACACILLCVLGLSAYQLDSALQQLSWQSPKTVWGDGFVMIGAFPMIAGCGFAILMFMAGKRRVGALAALSLSTLLLIASVSQWDQRLDVVRAVETPPAVAHPFAAHVPITATVYWPNQLAAVWGLLERASHYSPQQGAGVLFNRDTGLLFGPRKEMYRLINDDHRRCLTGASFSRSLENRLRCDTPALHRLTTLCSHPEAPDFLVLSERLPVEPLATWSPPEYRDPPQTYSLYACSQLKPHGTA